MNKIVNINKAIQIASQLHRRNEKIILSGGCFDILHIGHIKFLQSAKKLGGKLFIFLESDEKVSLLKGNHRPVFGQKERALTLASLNAVDCIITLPYFNRDNQYGDLLKEIAPDFIAVTENDPILKKKTLQARSIKAKIKVIPFFASLSSSKIAAILAREKSL